MFSTGSPKDPEKEWSGYTSRRLSKRKGVMVKKRYPGQRECGGLPEGTTNHDLRKFVATTLEDLDVLDATKSKILGHGKKNVTQRYIEPREKTMRKALEKLEQALWEGRSDEVRAEYEEGA